MDQGMSQLIYLLDSINWSSSTSLNLCSSALRTKINNLEDSIPEIIDDDWFSLPQNIPLSFKLNYYLKEYHTVTRFDIELE